MDDVINEAKGNGAGKKNQRDLIFYLVGKIDKIEDKIDHGFNQIHEKINNHVISTNNKLDKKLDKKSFSTMMVTGLTLSVTILGGIFGFICYKIF